MHNQILDTIKNLPPNQLAGIVRHLTDAERDQLFETINELNRRTEREECQNHFMPFVKKVWPDFIEGAHHRRMAAAFERLIDGDCKRLIINMPPRTSKSRLGSVLLPAWYLGKYPKGQVIQASHTTDLAVGFGRDVRNMLDSPDYHEIFPDVSLRVDSKAAGRWNTNHSGAYNALGVLAAMAGIGGNLIVIDDPISEAVAMAGIHNPDVYNKIYEWFVTGPRQRMQPDGRILIIQCVEENQRVLLASGIWRPIKDIQVGDSVTTYVEGQPIPQKVLAASAQGEDDLLEVITASTSVKVNARHPFLVVEGGLSIGPKTQEDVIKSRDWRLVWRQAGELKPGNMIVTIKSLGRSVINGHRPVRMGSSRQFNQEEYWLFGFLFGDGWLINSGDRGVVGFCIAASNHKDVDRYVIDLVKKYYGLDMKLTKHGYYRADNKERGRWLAKKGFCSGAKKKRIPEWVFKLRACDKLEFLRGFFAADGYLRKAKRKVETYTIGLANKALVDDLRLLARTCGVKTTKIYTATVECQPPNSPKPIVATHYRANFTFKNNKVELNKRYKNQSPNGNNQAQYFRFEEVEAINPVGRGIVYDLTVEGSENFIAEGCVVHNTRWSKIDLTGQVLRAAAQRGGEQWEVIEFPAILPSGKSLWPEFWPIEQLEAIRDEIPASNWAAQYQQSPTSDNAAIIKREWWKIWEKDDPPKCNFILQAWDTAYETKTVNDYSACQTWGVWYNDEDHNQPNLILLNAVKKRLEFPDLKKRAMEEYEEWEPDSIIIEKKASGASLIQELRRMGIPVIEYSPGKGQDKISRLNSVSDIIANGKVWVPQTRWAEELMDEVAQFPIGEFDDAVDVLTLILMRYRTGGWLRLDSDVKEETSWFKSSRKKAYY